MVKDEELLRLARIDAPERADVLASVSPPAARRYWRELLDVAAEASREDAAQIESPAKPLGRSEQDATKAMRELAHERAAALGIAPELLARRRDLDACVRAHRTTGTLPPRFRGWRYHCVGTQFESLLRQS